jgi:hypothetical protein
LLETGSATFSAVGLPQDVSHATGIAAVISSKNVIDFPRLLTGCRRLAYFAGYSERALFARAPTVAAIEKLIENGRELRILLTHPESAAVTARSAAPLYTEENPLAEEIRRSLKAFGELRDRLVGRVGATVSDRCRIRVTKQLPACAYFFIDHHCFTSLYTQSLSGGSGPSMVYEPGVGRVTYYDILMQDFNAAWDTAEER